MEEAKKGDVEFRVGGRASSEARGEGTGRVSVSSKGATYENQWKTLGG